MNCHCGFSKGFCVCPNPSCRSIRYAGIGPESDDELAELFVGSGILRMMWIRSASSAVTKLFLTSLAEGSRYLLGTQMTLWAWIFQM